MFDAPRAPRLPICERILPLRIMLCETTESADRRGAIHARQRALQRASALFRILSIPDELHQFPYISRRRKL